MALQANLSTATSKYKAFFSVSIKSYFMPCFAEVIYFFCFSDSRPIDDDPMIGNKSFHQDPTRQMNQTVVDSDHNAQGIYCQTRKINKDGSRVWVTENRATLNCCKKISGNCVAISRPSPHALHFLEDRFCLFRTDDQRRKFQLCCSQDKFHYEIETPARVDLPCTQY